jgi:asparagine synthase (glutamine-hydrolysing)
MSGIAGVILADRQHPIPLDLADQQAQAIAQRGPDGVASLIEGNVYLGHAHRDTTGFREHNLDETDARLRIVADIRLDNRAELANALGIAGAASISDVQLIVRAYLRWAEDCCEHLVGDFAFAIWDEVDGTLFCARDQMGVKPLFYAQSDDRFAFSSELAGVAQARAPVDEARMAGFLLGFSADPAITAFRGANRLPAGHCLTLRHGNLTVRRYWSLHGEPHNAHRSAAEMFRERLDDAVTARLRGTSALGAMLSGGLDSSSIVALAARRLDHDASGPLQTYSFDYPASPQLGERDYVEAVLDTYPMAQPRFVGFDDLAPLLGLDRLACGRSDLLFAPGLPKMTRLFAAAQGSGSRVLLDGHGGDEVVSHGFGRLSELAAAGDWFALYRELRGAAGLFGESANRMFLRYFTSYGPGRRLQRLVRRLQPAPTAASQPTSLSFLAPAFAARADADARYRQWRERLRDAHASEASLHAWNVSMPEVGEAFEALDRAATLANVELRFPFYDLRLVSFAVGVPSHEILRDGWTRSLLRRAMDGILPATVQWRRDKIDFSSEVRLGLVRHHRDVLAEISRGDSPIGAYIDIGRLRAAISRLIERPASADSTELFIIWRSAFLSYWLRSRGA